MYDLGIVWSGLLRWWQRLFAAGVVQGEVSGLERCEFRPQGLNLGHQGLHGDVRREVHVSSHSRCGWRSYGQRERTTDEEPACHVIMEELHYSLPEFRLECSGGFQLLEPKDH